MALNKLKSITINNAGNGVNSGSSFNGSSPINISYNTIGAPSVTGNNASGIWPITSTNVIGGSGQVLYNNAINSTTTSSNLTFDGTNLAVGGTVTASSDINLKENIREINNALLNVLKMRGVIFDWIDGEKDQVGVIAQEIEKIYPKLVRENSDGLKSVAYQNMIAILIEAIKEQNEIILSLSSRLDKLEFKEL